MDKFVFNKLLVAKKKVAERNGEEGGHFPVNDKLQKRNIRGKKNKERKTNTVLRLWGCLELIYTSVSPVGKTNLQKGFFAKVLFFYSSSKQRLK